MRHGLLADVKAVFEAASHGGLDCTGEELQSELARLRRLQTEVLQELRRASLVDCTRRTRPRFVRRALLPQCNVCKAPPGQPCVGTCAQQTYGLRSVK